MTSTVGHASPSDEEREQQWQCQLYENFAENVFNYTYQLLTRAGDECRNEGCHNSR